MLETHGRQLSKWADHRAVRGLTRETLGIDWILAFVTFAGLTILSMVGSVGALVFILTSVLLGVRRLPRLLEGAYRNHLLFILPLLFLLSMLWSDYPMTTLRAATQYFVTVLAAVSLASCINSRVLASASFVALLLTILSCLSLGLGAYLGGNEQALHLILGSKNQLAEYGAFLIIASLGIVLDAVQPAPLRALAAIGVMLAVFVLYVADSAGTSLFIIPAVLTMLALPLLSLLPGHARVAYAVLILLFIAAAGLTALTFMNDASEILDMLGKDSTLTGRSDLWADAQRYFMERPVLGVGYQAFWQIGNQRAELQWLSHHVPIGAGFNFHNLYLNTAVELGIVGVIMLCILLFCMIIRLFMCLFGIITQRHILAAGVFVYLLGISSCEVIQTYQFTAATVLFYVSWCYLRPCWVHVRPTRGIDPARKIRGFRGVWSGVAARRTGTFTQRKELPPGTDPACVYPKSQQQT